MRQVSTVENPGLSFVGNGLVVGGNYLERMFLEGSRSEARPTSHPSRGLFDLLARDDHAVLVQPRVRGGQHLGDFLLGLLGLFVAFASVLGHRSVPCLPGGGCRQRLTGVSARHQGRAACAGTEPVGERWGGGVGTAGVGGGGAGGVGVNSDLRSACHPREGGSGAVILALGKSDGVSVVVGHDLMRSLSLEALSEFRYIVE